jgi:hypothetical protein
VRLANLPGKHRDGCIADRSQEVAMNRAANPLIVSLFFLARCLLPLFFMLAVSYALKRLGLLPQTPPSQEEAAQGPDERASGENNGGVLHGSA